MSESTFIKDIQAKGGFITTKELSKRMEYEHFRMPIGFVQKTSLTVT